MTISGPKRCVLALSWIALVAIARGGVCQDVGQTPSAAEAPAATTEEAPAANEEKAAAQNGPAESTTSSEPRATDAPQAEQPPAPTAAEIAAWLEQLDSRRYRVREEATQRLLEAGEGALDPLLRTSNSDRPEPADRARWVLQKLAKSDDTTQAIAALERLVQLRDRPSLVAQAEAELTRITVQICRRQLESLGAECVVQRETTLPKLVVATVFHVKLGGNWRGTNEDLRPLAELQYLQHFRLEGLAIDDETVKIFEAREALAWLQLINSNVSVDAVDSLKTRHPNCDVYLKNQALLGVRSRNHAAGVFVELVEPGTAAHAAGITSGDVITSIDGRPLPDFDRLTAHIAQHEPGDVIVLEILRGEETKTLSVTLGSWEQIEGQ